MSKEPFLVKPNWNKSVFIPHTGCESYRVLFYDDGEVRFEHRCLSGAGDSIICAPLLSSHQIDSKEPLNITPSIHCEGCSLHGFVRDGRWVEA